MLFKVNQQWKQLSSADQFHSTYLILSTMSSEMSFLASLTLKCLICECFAFISIIFTVSVESSVRQRVKVADRMDEMSFSSTPQFSFHESLCVVRTCVCFGGSLFQMLQLRRLHAVFIFAMHLYLNCHRCFHQHEQTEYYEWYPCYLRQVYTSCNKSLSGFQTIGYDVCSYQVSCSMLMFTLIRSLILAFYCSLEVVWAVMLCYNLTYWSIY